MQKHLQKTLFVLITTITLTYALLPVGEAAVTNTDKVIAALRHPFPDLRLVAAHRGLWGAKKEEYDAPENSIRAVQNAADAGIEMAEIDLKEMQDGTVILMHDWNLGRTTDISYFCEDITGGRGVNCFNNEAFDPYDNYGWNPPVNSISLNTLLKYTIVLRNQELNSSPLDGPPPTLDQVLQAVCTSKPIVLLLDIKDQKTAKDAWQIVKKYKNSYGTPAYKWVIFKLNATIYPNSGSLETDLGLLYCDETGCHQTVDYNNFLFIPVFTSNMITKINCINTYNGYKDKPYTVTAEVNLKDYHGRNSDVYDAITNKGTAMLIFHAVPDAIQMPAPPDKGYYFKNTGAGVYQLKDLLQPPVPGQPNEVIDRRYDLNFILGLNFRGITTDDSLGVANELTRRGWRNMSHIQNP
jgi:glycerophosphoryl diester phosphodiesterase